MSSSATTDQAIQGLLLAMLDQAPEHAVLLLDPNGHITAWLGAADEVFGYASHEVVGRPHVMLFTPEDIEKGVPNGELATARHGAPAEDDRWMLRKDGLRIWASGVLHAVRSSEGTVRGFGKIVRNRTDLKGQLDTLKNHSRSLEVSNERKNKFISTLSHELRNPLASLTYAAAALKAVIEPTEKGTFAISVIERQVDAMCRMVDDLLEITRLGAGKIRLEMRDESLEEILAAAIEDCRSLIEDRGREFHFVVGSSPVCVRADAPRLKQVFINLLENAVKYTQHSGSIWVGLMVDGREAVTKVTDNGIGISPELLPRIFDMFTQSEFAAGQGEGLGIGLSVVKDLVRLHGGSVQVRSDGVGKGSEFTVRLPLAGPDLDRPDTPGGR